MNGANVLDLSYGGYFGDLMVNAIHVSSLQILQIMASL